MPLFSTSPDERAGEAAVFWDPRACPQVLPALALPSGRRQGPSFRLDGLRCRAALLLTPDGLQHLLLHENCYRLQLAVAGASLFEDVHLLVAALVEPRRLSARLGALDRLNRLHANGRPVRLPSAELRRARRLGLVLRALDGWLAGVSYRDIAVGLFGRARVEADWSDPRDHLRDRVRRAVRRGRALMDGGYRQLLQ